MTRKSRQTHPQHNGIRAVTFLTLLVIVVVLLAAWLADRTIVKDTQLKVSESLENILRITHQALHSLERNNIAAAKAWASDAKIIAHTQALLTRQRDPASLLAAPEQLQLRQWFAPLREVFDYRGYFIIAPDGTNLSSSRDNNTGTKTLLAVQPQVLARAWQGQAVFSLPQPSDVPIKDASGKLRADLPTMFALAPIRDASQQIIALLAFRIDPSRDFNAILARAQIGHSGETFAFNRDGYLLNPSRHEDVLRSQGLLDEQADSTFHVRIASALLHDVMADDSAPAENIHQLGEYPGYWGEPVVGAWLWDAEMNFGLGAEISAAEVFALRHIQRATLVTISGLLIVMLLALLALHKTASRNLSRSREQFKLLADHANDMISRHDIAGNYLYVSPACTTLLGYPPGQLIGHSAYEFFHPDDLEAVRKSHTTIAEAPQTYTVSYRIRHRLGHYLWFETVSKVITTESGDSEIIAVSRDISQRKQAEADLRESELRYRAVVDSLGEGLVIQNPQGDIISANQQAGEILGISSEELLGHNSHDPLWGAIRQDGSPFPGEEHPAMVTLASGQPQTNVIMGLNRPDQAQIWISINSQPLWSNHNNHPSAVVTTFRDISKQHHLQQSLQNSNRALQILSACNEVLIHSDEERELLQKICDLIVAIGHYPLAWVGWAEHDAQKTVKPYTSAGHASGYLEHIRVHWGMDDYSQGPTGQAIRTGQLMVLRDMADNTSYHPWRAAAAHYGFTASIALPIKEGKTTYGSLNIYADNPGAFDDEEISLMQNLAANLAFGISTLHSRAKHEHLQHQLLQAQKMESLGQLTGGVAHDFNNILAAIMGYTELLMTLPEDWRSEQKDDYLAQVLRAAERGRDLVRQMLAFSRTGASNPTNIQAKKVVHEVMEMLRPAFPASISLILDCEDNLPDIHADEIQLEQVITNLCINARDAMNNKGEITIRVDTTRIVQRECTSCHQNIAGSYVRFAVSDNGKGMDEKLIASIFEPFFTTKETGKGTGMGLAVVHGIVHEHQGHILVDSRPFVGTTISVLLPVVPKNKAKGAA